MRMEEMLFKVVEGSVVASAFVYILHYVVKNFTTLLNLMVQNMEKFGVSLQSVGTSLQSVSEALLKINYRLESLESRIKDLEERVGKHD